MPKLTVPENQVVKIPGSATRRQLRWRIASSGDGGSQTHVSLRSNVDPADTAKCGVPFEVGEGETLFAHQSDLKKPLYFRATTGTSVVWYDTDSLDPAFQ